VYQGQWEYQTHFSAQKLQSTAIIRSLVPIYCILSIMMKLHVLKISYFFYQIIDMIIEFSFIIFSDFIHFMKCFILSAMYYNVLFFHRYQLYNIAFYYSYVNPFTINLCGGRVKNLVNVNSSRYT